MFPTKMFSTKRTLLSIDSLMAKNAINNNKKAEIMFKISELEKELKTIEQLDHYALNSLLNKVRLSIKYNINIYEFEEFFIPDIAGLIKGLVSAKCCFCYLKNGIYYTEHYDGCYIDTNQKFEPNVYINDLNKIIPNMDITKLKYNTKISNISGKKEHYKKEDNTQNDIYPRTFDCYSYCECQHFLLTYIDSTVFRWTPIDFDEKL